MCDHLRRTFSPDVPDYSLPAPTFIFVEALGWFAQTFRSGAITYYEATPRIRQKAMFRVMREYAPEMYAEWYKRGMADWSDEERIGQLDAWIDANEDALHDWLRTLVVMHRDIVLELTA